MGTDSKVCLLLVVLIVAGRPVAANTPDSREVDSRTFTALGLSVVSKRLAEDTHNDEQVLTFQLSQRVFAGLNIIEEFNSADSSKSHDSVLVGVSWGTRRLHKSSLDPWWWWTNRYFDPGAFYAQFVVGAERVRNERITRKTLGPAIEGSIAWLPLQGDDYSFGIEIRSLVSRYSTGLECSLSGVILVRMER
jgi:hypothetical protein